ncbi:MAG: Yip1 family protein [Roseovarius sp.]
MDWTFQSISARLAQTVKTPKEAAAALMGLRPSHGVLWQMMALVVVLSVILAFVSTLLVPVPAGMEMMPLLTNPLLLGVVQASLLVTSVFATYWVGRAFGGTGRFDDTILLIVWLQVVMVVVQAAQTVFLLLLPPVASLIGVVGIVLFVWLFVNFVAVLHGFRSLGLVLVGATVSMFSLIFGLSILLTLIGAFASGM